MPPSSPFRFPTLAHLLVLGLVVQAGPRAAAEITVMLPTAPVLSGMKVHLLVPGYAAKGQKFAWRSLDGDPGLLQGDPGYSTVFTAPQVDAPRTFRFQVTRLTSPQESKEFTVEVSPWPRMTLTAGAERLFPGETCVLTPQQDGAHPRNNQLGFLVDLQPDAASASPATLRIADSAVNVPQEGPITFTAPAVDRPTRCRVTARSYSARPASVELRILPRLQAEAEQGRTGLMAGESLKVLARRNDGKPADWSWEVLEPKAGALKPVPARDEEDDSWEFLDSKADPQTDPGLALYTAPADLQQPLDVHLRATDRHAQDPQHVDLTLHLSPRVPAQGPAQPLPSVTLFAGSPRQNYLGPHDPSEPPFHEPRALAHLECRVAGMGTGWLMGGQKGVWSVTGDGKEPILIPALGRDVVAMAAAPAASQTTALVVAHEARWPFSHVPIPYCGATQAYLTVLGTDGQTRLLAGSKDFVANTPNRPNHAIQPIFRRITGLAMDERGNVAVAEGSGRILVVTPDGTVRILAETNPMDMNMFWDIVYDRTRGVLYASSPRGLYEVTRTGRISPLWTPDRRGDALDIRHMVLYKDKLLLDFPDEEATALHVFDLKEKTLTALVPATGVGQPLRQGPLPRFAPSLAPGVRGAMPHPGCLATSPGGACLAGMREGVALLDLRALVPAPASSSASSSSSPAPVQPAQDKP